MEKIWETQLKCAGNNNYNQIKVTIYYDLGDYSLFTGKKNPRGYYVSVRPSKMVEENGFITETIQVFGGGGYKHLLVECSRKSNKNATLALEKGANFYPQMIDYICKEQGLKIIDKEK